MANENKLFSNDVDWYVARTVGQELPPNFTAIVSAGGWFSVFRNKYMETWFAYLGEENKIYLTGSDIDWQVHEINPKASSPPVGLDAMETVWLNACMMAAVPLMEESK